MRIDQTHHISLHKAVGQWISEALGGRARPVDLGILADQMVDGAFVSLRSGSELRACIGCIGEQRTLTDALRFAATKAVSSDGRFAPITRQEFPGLDCEIHVLYDMRALTVEAAQRPKHIVIGEHGLQLVQGHRRGLLLATVAVEQKWDAVAFLRAVCRKAGLPESAWESSGNLLCLFRECCLVGPLLAEAGDVG